MVLNYGKRAAGQSGWLGGLVRALYSMGLLNQFSQNANWIVCIGLQRLNLGEWSPFFRIWDWELVLEIRLALGDDRLRRYWALLLSLGLRFSKSCKHKSGMLRLFCVSIVMLKRLNWATLAELEWEVGVESRTLELLQLRRGRGNQRL